MGLLCKQTTLYYLTTFQNALVKMILSTKHEQKMGTLHQQLESAARTLNGLSEKVFSWWLLPA